MNAEFCTWLDGRTVKCTGEPVGQLHWLACEGGCLGSGRVPDPIARAVYEKLTRECYGCKADDWDDWVRGVHQKNCPERVPIDFDAVGEGAFEGVIARHFGWASLPRNPEHAMEMAMKMIEEVR